MKLFNYLFTLGLIFCSFTALAKPTVDLQINSSLPGLEVSVSPLPKGCPAFPASPIINETVSLTPSYTIKKGYLYGVIETLCAATMTFGIGNSKTWSYNFTIDFNKMQIDSAAGTPPPVIRSTNSFIAYAKEKGTDKVFALAASLYPSHNPSLNNTKIIIDVELKPDNWQADLASRISNYPINGIIMPSSHDTGTYGINSSKAITIDFQATTEINSLFGNPVLKTFTEPAMKIIMAGWAKTQNYDVATQLLVGVRHFDIRLCGRNKGVPTYLKEVVTCHSLQGAAFKDMVTQVSQFIEKHPKEIIILNMNHFHDINNEQMFTITSLLKNTFGDKIASPQNFSPLSKYSDFWNANKQIIVIWNMHYSEDIYWDVDSIYSPWPNRNSAAGLQLVLAEYLQNTYRPKNQFFALKTAATETSEDIGKALNPFSAKNVPRNIEQFTATYKQQIQTWLIKNQASLNSNGTIIDNDFTDGLFAIGLMRRQVGYD